MRALDLLRQKIPLPWELQKLQKDWAPDQNGPGEGTAKTAKSYSCSYCRASGRPFLWRRRPDSVSGKSARGASYSFCSLNGTAFPWPRKAPVKGMACPPRRRSDWPEKTNANRTEMEIEE